MTKPCKGDAQSEVLYRALVGVEAKLQSLEWHRINRTVNDEIFADLIKSAIAEARAAVRL